jgi:hypothetical protein
MVELLSNPTLRGKRCDSTDIKREAEEYGDAGGFFGASPKRSTRKADVTCLEILVFGLVTYTFDVLSGLSDLYDTAAYSASNVDALIDAILEKT